MIRQAKKDDAKECIEILELAMADFTDVIVDTKNHDEKLEKLENFFKSKNNRISHENILVYEHENQVVGAVCSYEGWLSDFLDMPFNENLKLKKSNATILKECENDEYYIDSIAVNENFRGRGFFKQLMFEIIEMAKKTDLKKISLITQTPDLYTKFGFKFIKNMDFYGEVYAKMIKEI